MELLNSKKFPGLSYTPGEDVWIGPGEQGLPFYFDISGDLTADKEAMGLIGAFLDDLEGLRAKAVDCLKAGLAGSPSERQEMIRGFLEMHQEEMEPEALGQIFGEAGAEGLEPGQMIGFLKVKRFGSCIDEDWKEQAFIMDLSFGPEYTDELLVIYFGKNGEVRHIAHES